MVRVPDAKSDCSRRGEAEVRILKFKTTWSELHHLPRVGPKQLCALVIVILRYRLRKKMDLKLLDVQLSGR